jgi:hypothetical protein
MESPTESSPTWSVESVPCSSGTVSPPARRSARAGVPSATGSTNAGCCSAAGSALSVAGIDRFDSGITGAAADAGLGSTGVTGVASLGRFDSRFFSSVRKNTLIVVRSALCGLQSSADNGECSQTGHEGGSVAWQLSQIACSQQGKRNALRASLLQMAHLSFAGISS